MHAESEAYLDSEDRLAAARRWGEDSRPMWHGPMDWTVGTLGTVGNDAGDAGNAPVRGRGAQYDQGTFASGRSGVL